MNIVSYFIFVLAFLRVMLHMYQEAFQYLSQPVTGTEMRLDTDSLYRKKCASRHVYVEEHGRACLVTPNNVLFTGRENWARTMCFIL
jgi:hypothetical protein